VVINGVIQVIGSDRQEIDRAIAAAEANRVPAIPVSLKRNGDKIDIEIGPGSGTMASIYLLTVACETRVDIRHGENRGKTITYVNAVRSWRKFGEWTGPIIRASVPVSELTSTGADGLAVLVQAGSAEQPGPIRGAAFLDIH